jgi:hypothetical protein
VSIDRLVDAIAGQYRWGLHPLKVLIALLLPVVIVWFADRRIRTRTDLIEEAAARTRPLPRLRRR